MWKDKSVEGQFDSFGFIRQLDLSRLNNLVSVAPRYGGGVISIETVLGASRFQ